MKRSIAFYDEQERGYAAAKAKNSHLNVDEYIDLTRRNISWTVNLKSDLQNGTSHKFNAGVIKESIYRPFTKQLIYFDKPFIERPGLTAKFFPTPEKKNLVICVSAPGGTKELTPLICDCIPDLHFNGDTQAFPLYYYEERDKANRSLFDANKKTEYVRRDGVSDWILGRAQTVYGKRVSKEDIFYYVYGLLHSAQYRLLFANDLKKMLPRLPLLEVKEFWEYSKAGRKLADLHLNYESVPPYDGAQVEGEISGFFTVEKMRFPQKGQKHTIHFNHRITVSQIPDAAYEYVVNGKSAIEWIMERYQVKVDKDSGLKNDPNDWAQENGNPRYILDLLLSVINVSVQTVAIVNALPQVKFE